MATRGAGHRSIGLCAGHGGVYTVTRAGGQVLAAQVVPASNLGDASGGLGDALADAFRGLDEPSGKPLSISLLPSLAPGRILAAGDAPAGGLLADPPHRSNLEPAVTARSAIPTAAEDYVAQCPCHILSRVAEALGAGGCSAEAVTPGDFAWCAATAEVASCCVAVVQMPGDAPETRLLAATAGEPVALRRLPHDAATATLASVLRAMAERWGGRGETISLLALGDSAFRAAIHAAGSAAGLAPATPGGLVADLHFDPGFVAATYAGAGPRFVPPEIVTAALARRRWWTVGMAAAAVVLLGLAGALQTLGVSRELDGVQAARTGAQRQVDAALAMTNEAAGLGDALATLRDLRAAAPRWSSVLTDLSERIPAGTYATAVRIVGDSIYLEMEGEDAARAFQGIRAMRGLAGFRAAAPLRREVGEGSRVIERFTAAATVSWPRPTESGGGTP